MIVSITRICNNNVQEGKPNRLYNDFSWVTRNVYYMIRARLK